MKIPYEGYMPAMLAIMEIPAIIISIYFAKKAMPNTNSSMGKVMHGLFTSKGTILLLRGIYLGHWAGLSMGGATIFGLLCASISYIAAPAAVRIAIPKANPTLYLKTFIPGHALTQINYSKVLAISSPIYSQSNVESKWIKCKCCNVAGQYEVVRNHTYNGFYYYATTRYSHWETCAIAMVGDGYCWKRKDSC